MHFGRVNQVNEPSSSKQRSPSLQLTRLSQSCLQCVCFDACLQDDSSERGEEEEAAVAVAAAGKVIAKCVCFDACLQDESSELGEEEEDAADDVVACLPSVSTLTHFAG